MAHQVFISYSSADKATADLICGGLEEAGIRCWIAPRNIEPGVHYPTAIMDAVTAARTVVLVLSDTAQASPHVLTEVEEAFHKRKRIVPFRITTAPLSKELDYFLSLSQWLDAPDGPTAANLARLAEAVQRENDRVWPPAPPPPPPVRRWLVPAMVMVALVAASVLAYLIWPEPKLSVIPPPSIQTPPQKETSPDAPKPKMAGGLEYVWIPPGTFTMGCSAGDAACAEDEKPAHPVEIEKGFWLGKTEVTVAAFRKSEVVGKDGNMPMRDVPWPDAKSYCSHIGGRLPTEAEWEYAARGGKGEAVYGPVPKIAWYEGNSQGGPHPVAQKTPNAYGLYDMLGNVAEWVLDRYYNRYDLEAPSTGPKVEQPDVGTNATAALRGGFWATPVESVRVSRRSSRSPDEPDVMVGFRCAIDP